MILVFFSVAVSFFSLVSPINYLLVLAWRLGTYSFFLTDLRRDLRDVKIFEGRDARFVVQSTEEVCASAHHQRYSTCLHLQCILECTLGEASARAYNAL